MLFEWPPMAANGFDGRLEQKGIKDRPMYMHSMTIVLFAVASSLVFQIFTTNNLQRFGEA